MRRTLSDRSGAVVLQSEYALFMDRRRVLIVGAAGRDFHNFNLVYRGRAEFEVVAFTATQIPNIDGRRLSGRAGG